LGNVREKLLGYRGLCLRGFGFLLFVLDSKEVKERMEQKLKPAKSEKHGGKSVFGSRRDVLK